MSRAVFVFASPAPAVFEAQEDMGLNGEFKVDVKATTEFQYDNTFIENETGCIRGHRLGGGDIALKNKQVKGVVDALFSAACGDITKNSNFKLAGMLNLKLKKKLSIPANRNLACSR